MKKHSLVQRVKYKKIYKRYLFICYHTFISYEEHAKSHSNEIEISEKSLKYFSNSPLCMPQKNVLKFTILYPSCNLAPNPPKLVKEAEAKSSQSLISIKAAAMAFNLVNASRTGAAELTFTFLQDQEPSNSSRA